MDITYLNRENRKAILDALNERPDDGVLIYIPYKAGEWKSYPKSSTGSSHLIASTKGYVEVKDAPDEIRTQTFLIRSLPKSERPKKE